MSAENDPNSLMICALSMEEMAPFFNRGGQRTFFSGNSIQWGAGHGLALSSLPVMADVEIKGNEIQNHGLSGILIAETIFYPLDNPLYKLRITDNEINQCFINGAYMLSWPPPNPDSPNLPPTFLGGLMVKDAVEVYCVGNTILACGRKVESFDTWPAFGTLFLGCNNNTYEGNTIVQNGREPEVLSASEGMSYEELFFPRGGAAFLDGTGNLSIKNNTFKKNSINTLMIIPRWLIDTKFDDTTGIYTYIYTIPAQIQVLDKVVILGNIISIDDMYVSEDISNWSKIQIGYCELDSTGKILVCNLENLIFSQNHVSLINNFVEKWKGIYIAVKNNLIYNGNMVTGDANVIDPELVVNQDPVAFGNIPKIV